MDVDKRFKKVRTPPSLPNWVLLNHSRRYDTSRSIARFVLGSPKFNLFPILAFIIDFVTLQVPKADVMSAVRSLKNSKVRTLGEEVLEAVLPWLEAENIRGLRVFQNFKVMYPIGRGVFVPVVPTFTFNDAGKLTFVFVIPWAEVRFNRYQKRLLLTLIHEAILTQEDFLDADALVLFTPRHKLDKKTRFVKRLRMGDVQFLTREQLVEQFDRFGNALDDAVPIVLQELARRGEI
ncbi:MAG: hypothetical protein V2J26_11860 [Pacificimonas sp.]|jgi:hypothetical protein|nr:hypothetical protein [Pacificimonas sp.]